MKHLFKVGRLAENSEEFHFFRAGKRNATMARMAATKTKVPQKTARCQEIGRGLKLIVTMAIATSKRSPAKRYHCGTLAAGSTADAGTGAVAGARTGA